MTTKKNKTAITYRIGATANGNSWPLSVTVEAAEVNILRPLHNWPNKPAKAKQAALVNDFIDHVDSLTFYTRIWSGQAADGEFKKMKGTSANNRTHGFAQVVARMIAAQAIEAARVGLDQEMMLVGLRVVVRLLHPHDMRLIGRNLRFDGASHLAVAHDSKH